MSSSDAVRVKTDQLPVDSRLGHPINDNKDRLLLAAGVTVTQRLKDRLIARGILEVLLHPDDVAALFGDKKEQTRTSTETAKSKSPRKKLPPQPTETPGEKLRETLNQIKSQAVALGATVSRQIKISGPPLNERQVEHGTTPYSVTQRERLEGQFADSCKLLDETVQQAIEGIVTNDLRLREATLDYVSELLKDTDNVIASSSELAPNPTITERGIRLSLLAMAMAIELDWDEENVREVGLCGMLHDFGMFQLDAELQDQQSQLSAESLTRFRDHPLHTLDMMRSMKSVSLPVRLAATQIHEKPDGSGYPRGIKGDEIHPYASILHVADTYISLTAEMHGRQAFLSYDVMVYLLNQVKSKRMDESAVRALLQAVSLFPIGSHVRLSDGSEALVIRRNRTNYTTPVVQRVGADRQARFDSAHASIIDLSQVKLSVMTPLVPPHREEIRLDESQMGELLQ